MELFSENAAVLHVLPLIDGLFERVSLQKVLEKYLERFQQRGLKIEGLGEIMGKSLEKALETLVVNEEKSLLLSMTFGREYLRAVEIIFNGDILLKVLKQEGELHPEILKKFIQSSLTDPYRVLVRDDRDDQEDQKGQNGQDLELLQFEKLLQFHFGLTVSAMNTLERTHIVSHSGGNSASHSGYSVSHSCGQSVSNSGSHCDEYLVDLANWYCTCDTYQSCYVMPFFGEGSIGYNFDGMVAKDESVVAKDEVLAKESILAKDKSIPAEDKGILAEYQGIAAKNKGISLEYQGTAADDQTGNHVDKSMNHTGKGFKNHASEFTQKNPFTNHSIPHNISDTSQRKDVLSVFSAIFSKPKTNMLNPFPICRHLLAVLIYISNLNLLPNKIKIVSTDQAREFFGSTI